MVAAKDDGSMQFAATYGIVEGQGNACAAFAIGIKDACL